MSEITYRALVIGDYDEVAELWDSVPGIGLSGADSREGISALLERNPGLSTVATDGRRLVGVVLCSHDGRRGYLTHLAVAKSHRRSGIGRTLADTCIELLAGAGIEKCHIVVFTNNADALAYWRSTGWIERTELAVLSRFTPAARHR